MSGLLAKLRIVAIGNAHDLLDKAIDMNSPSALRQSIRDLEDAMGKLLSEKGNQAGNLATLQRQQKDLNAEISSLSQTIQLFMEKGHEDLARPKATRLVQAKAELESKTQQIQSQQADLKEFSTKYDAIRQLHDTRLNKLHELENLDRQSKANEQAKKALDGINSLVSGGVDISVDNIEEKIRARNDNSKAQLNQVMDSIPEPASDPVIDAQVDDVLASFRKPAAEAAPAPPANTATA